MTVEAAAAELQARDRILPELAAALTYWSGVRRSLDSESDHPSWQHLLSVADAIDPDPWRLRVRSEWRRQDSAAEAAPLQELAESMDMTSVPPSTIALLAGMLTERLGNESAVPVWLQGQKQFPSDFWINYRLGTCLLKINPDEAEMYLRVAYALRPERCLTMRSSNSWIGSIALIR